MFIFISFLVIRSSAIEDDDVKKINLQGSSSFIGTKEKIRDRSNDKDKTANMDLDTKMEMDKNMEKAEGEQSQGRDVAAANVLAQSPDWKVCEQDAESKKCQAARQDAVIKFDKEQNTIEGKLKGAHARLNVLENEMKQRTPEVVSLEKTINGGSKSIGLIKEVKQITDAILEVQTTLQGQSQALAVQAQAQAAMLEEELDHIRNVLDTKLSNLEKATQDFVNKQTEQQMKALAESGESFNNEVSSISSQATSNAKEIDKETQSQTKELHSFKDVSSQEFSDLESGIDQSESETKTIFSTGKDRIKKMLKMLRKAMQSSLDEVEKEGVSKYDRSKSGFDKELSKDTSKLEHRLETEEESLEKHEEVAGKQASNDISKLNTELKASKKKALKKNEDLKVSSQNNIKKLNEFQTHTASDMGKTSAVNSKSIEELETLLRDVSLDSDSQMNNLISRVINMSKKVKKDVSTDQTKFASSTGGELSDLIRKISSMEELSSSRGNRDNAELQGDMQSARVHMAQTGSANTEKINQAIGSVGDMEKLLQMQLRSGASVENKKTGQLSNVLNRELMDIQRTLGDEQTHSRRRDLGVKTGLNKDLSSSSLYFNDRVSRFGREQDANILNLQKKQQTSGIDMQSDLSNFRVALDATVNSLTGVTNAGKKLSDTFSYSDMENTDELNNLRSQIELGRDTMEHENSDANKKARVDTEAAIAREKRKINNLADLLTHKFEKESSKSSEQNQYLLSILSASSSKQKHILADEKSGINSAMSDIDNLSGTSKAEYQQLSAYLEREGSNSESKNRKYLYDVKQKELQRLSRFEKEMSGRVESESSDVGNKLDKSYKKQKHELDDFLSQLQTQNSLMEGLHSKSQELNEEVEHTAHDLATKVNGAKNTMDKTNTVQADKIRYFKNSLTNWTLALERQLEHSESVLKLGMLQIPKKASAKTSSIEKQMRMSQQQMKEYLIRFEKAFEESRANEAKYEREQAIRRLAAILGINEAILSGKTGLLEKLISGEMTSTERDRRVALVLNGLANAIELMKDEDGEKLKAIRTEILNLENESGTLYKYFETNLNKEMTELFHAQNADSNANKMMIQGYQLKNGRLISGLGNSVSSLLTDFKKDSARANLALALDKKDVYALGGLIHSFGDDTRIELSRLLHSIESGEETVESAVKKSREVDFSKITTVKDVVSAFVRVIESYLAESRLGFDDVRSKVNAFRLYLDGKLKNVDSALKTKSHSAEQAVQVTSHKRKALEKRIEDFTQIAKKDLYDLQEEHSQIKARQDAEVTDMKNEIRNTTNYIEKEEEKTATEIAEWVKTTGDKVMARVKDVEAKLMAASKN